MCYIVKFAIPKATCWMKKMGSGMHLGFILTFGSSTNSALTRSLVLWHWKSCLIEPEMFEALMRSWLWKCLNVTYLTSVQCCFLCPVMRLQLLGVMINCIWVWWKWQCSTCQNQNDVGILPYTVGAVIVNLPINSKNAACHWALHMFHSFLLPLPSFLCAC